MSDQPETKSIDGSGNKRERATYSGPTVGNPEGYHQYSLAELNAASVASRTAATLATNKVLVPLGEVGSAVAPGGAVTAPATAPVTPAPDANSAPAPQAGAAPAPAPATTDDKPAPAGAPVAWGAK